MRSLQRRKRRKMKSACRSTSNELWASLVVKIANIFLLDRPSRGGLSFIKRHTLSQSTSTDKSASVNRSHKLLDDALLGSCAPPGSRPTSLQAPDDPRV